MLMKLTEGPQTYKKFVQQMIISEIEDGSFASFFTDLCALLFLGMGFLAGVKFINFLRADFLPIFWHQKNFKPNDLALQF